MRIVQNMREACGGEGYLWQNQIGEIKADLDVFTTFEGDNTVLMLEHQLAFLELGNFYAERIAFQAIAQHIVSAKITQPYASEEIKLLETLAISFGIERILRNPEWFLTKNHFTGESISNARVTLNQTYRTIAKHSYDLTQAFGIPTECITAPIS